MYIVIFVGILMIVLGILIKHFKCYWLISGYNTMSKEKKKNVDTEGLGRFMGNSLFVMGGIFILGSILEYLGIKIGMIASILSLFIIVPYILINSQKYDKNALEPDGSMKKSTKLIVGTIIGVTGIIFIFVALTFIYGAQPPSVDIKDQYISIGGMYASTVHLEDIKEVILLDSIPNIIRKQNGFDLGNILRGKFSLESIGKGRLYINNGKPPYVYLKLKKGYIIINYNNSEKTQDLYNEIKFSING